MFLEVIALSIFLLYSWHLVWVKWRSANPLPTWADPDGFAARCTRGALPAAIGLTFFVAAFWILYFSSGGREGGAKGVGLLLGGILLGLGFIFVICYSVVYLVGSPRFLVVPAMRAKSNAKLRRPGERSGK